MRRGAAALVLALAGAAAAAGPTAHADAPARAAVVDGVAVRFYAPETGGPSRPLFITARTLAFEARLVALEEDPTSKGYAERDLRAALDQHVVEEMLAYRPLDQEPDEATVGRVADIFRQSLAQRTGGEAAFARAADAEGISSSEVEVVLRRKARAALYVERGITPVLFPTDEQLRQVYRTSAHPFRRIPYDQCRDDLARWLAVERTRAAEQTFYQTARDRVTVVLLRPFT